VFVAPPAAAAAAASWPLTAAATAAAAAAAAVPPCERTSAEYRLLQPFAVDEDELEHVLDELAPGR